MTDKEICDYIELLITNRIDVLKKEYIRTVEKHLEKMAKESENAYKSINKLLNFILVGVGGMAVIIAILILYR